MNAKHALQTAEKGRRIPDEGRTCPSCRVVDAVTSIRPTRHHICNYSSPSNPHLKPSHLRLQCSSRRMPYRTVPRNQKANSHRRHLSACEVSASGRSPLDGHNKAHTEMCLRLHHEARFKQARTLGEGPIATNCLIIHHFFLAQQ